MLNLNYILGSEVEKSNRQLIMFDLEFFEEVWFRDTNWEVVSIWIIYKP